MNTTNQPNPTIFDIDQIETIGADDDQVVTVTGTYDGSPFVMSFSANFPDDITVAVNGNHTTGHDATDIIACYDQAIR